MNCRPSSTWAIHALVFAETEELLRHVHDVGIDVHRIDRSVGVSASGRNIGSVPPPSPTDQDAARLLPTRASPASMAEA